MQESPPSSESISTIQLLMPETRGLGKHQHLWGRYSAEVRPECGESAHWCSRLCKWETEEPEQGVECEVEN